MIESPVYEMIKEEGRKEGYQQAYEEGRLEGLLGCLLDALAIKFGEIPLSLQNRIASVMDPEVLRQWLQTALRCKSVAEFENGLGD